MPVQTPAWFDASYYASQKIEQMNLTRYLGRTDWDMASYSADLASNNRTPYEDFLRVNDIHNLSYTNISPNRLFNVGEYLTALAEFANESGYSYPGYKAGEWTAQKAMEHMFNDYHVSAWDHFTLAGQYDLVNPSNAFDITAYYQQLTAWRNSYVDPETGITGWEGRTNWTLFDVLEDNIWAEVNPVEGLYTEAAGSGIYASAVPADERVTVESGWNPWISTDQSTPPTHKPDYNPGGSLTPPSHDDGSDPDEPDAIVSVVLEPGKLEYTSEGPLPTIFMATIASDSEEGTPESTLVPGVKITGQGVDYPFGDSLQVFLWDNFDGLGPYGYVKDVASLTLWNESNKSLTFNAENMSDLTVLNVADGPLTVTNWSNSLNTLSIFGVQPDEAVTEADVTVNLTEEALVGSDGYLGLSIGECGTEANPVKVAVDGAVKRLNIGNGTARGDDIESSLYNWLDISAMKAVNNIRVYNGSEDYRGELTLYADEMTSTEAVSISVEDTVSLLGKLNFTGATSLILGGSGSLGNADTALQVDAAKATNVNLQMDGSTNLKLAAAKAEIVVKGMDHNPEYMKLKVDKGASFTCDGVIRGDTVDLDLSGVTSQDGSGGSNVEIDATNVTCTGGKGDDTFFVLGRASDTAEDNDGNTFFVLARESATAEGNGGNDTFIAYAHNSSEATAEVVKVDFTGVVNPAAHERFVINTCDPTAKVAMTVTGFDENDSIEIHNVDEELLSFASVNKAEAESLIEKFGFKAPEGLEAIYYNDDSICGYYSADAKEAYGFAPYNFLSDSSNFVQTEGIAAVVKVTGIDNIDLAKAAFSFHQDFGDGASA